MKYLMLFLKQNKGKAVLAVVLLLGQVIGTLFIPYLIADIVDEGILKGDMQTVYAIGLQMFFVALLGAAVSVWGSFVTSDLGALFGKDIRERLIYKSQELSMQQFHEIGLSSMVTRATSDIANLQQTMGMMLQLAVPAPMIAVFSIVMTAIVSVPMALLQLFFIILLLGFAAVMLKKSGKLSRTIQKRLDNVNKIVRENITGVRVIRAFGNESYEEKRSEKSFLQYTENMVSLNRLMAFINPAVWMLLGLLITAVVALGGIFVLDGSMAIGQISAVSEYAILTISYLVMAAAAVSSLPKARSCMNRLEEVLDMIPDVKDEITVQQHFADNVPVVEFDHVTFAYQGAEKPVIWDLSFTCQPGTTTAIIGSTGSGKSTLADLLLRLHDIQTGRIRVKGADIRELSQEELRQQLGCVPQKAFLFSGTIADNLRMGNANASKEQMWEALSVAQAESFVKSLPLQLEAPVTQGGTNFSGGQRQRLSIARALIKEAAVLIFDDSFSALDVKTDANLREALRQRVTAPAKIIIAQRISTILEADQILVLEKGRLVGQGTHQALMESCTVYRAIAESQMKQGGI